MPIAVSVRTLGWLLLAAVAVFAAFSDAARAGEIDEAGQRSAIRAEAGRLLAERDFAALEVLANQYLQGQRTSSGDWKLTFFDIGIEEALKHAPRDEPYWTETNALLQQWTSDFPESATAHLAYARALLVRAWEYRGFDVAGTVADGDWAPFHELVSQARAYLESKKALATKNPLWYQMMLEIAKVQDWPIGEHTQLASEAMDLHPQYYQLYFNAVSNYLPQWGGSMTEIETFAHQAYLRTSASEGAAVYARIYWYVYRMPTGKHIFDQSDLDWSLVRRGMLEIAAKYPEQWTINQFAKFACLANDAELSLSFGRMMTTLYSPAVWRDQSEFNACQTAAQNAWTLPRFLHAYYYWIIAIIGLLLLIAMFALRRRKQRQAAL